MRGEPVGVEPQPPEALVPARSRWSSWPLLLLLVIEVLALSAFRTPEERFYRFAFWDSGAELVVQELVRRGARPTLDFGYLYGLLPLGIGRVWYGLFGLSPVAFRALALAGSLVMAWGLARFAGARSLGPAGLALVVLAIPDLLLPAAITLVHTLEPALLVVALAEHARGRRADALVIATACVFVKPALAYVYGLFLVIALVKTSWGHGRAAWFRAFAPATATGLCLAVLLSLTFGPVPVLRSLFPFEGPAAYRASGFGFFRGVGRDFWILPGAGLRGYFRYEVSFWLLGTLLLVGCGLAALRRLALAQDEHEADRLDDEVVACAAGLHAVFVTLLFTNRNGWVYDFAVLIVGLAALGRRDRRHAMAVGALAMLLLVSDRSKLVATAKEWTTLAPGAETLGLWATPRERAEWARVRALTQGRTPVLLALSEGAALLTPGFAPPVGGYYYAYARPSEIRRKAAQLAEAEMIVRAVPPDWAGFARWPELAHALDGCELAWQGQGQGQGGGSPSIAAPGPLVRSKRWEVPTTNE